MTIPYKSITSLLLTALLAVSCGKEKEKEEQRYREEFIANENLGIYKDGKPVLTFLKNTHQYYCNPSEGILRIIDNEGKRDVTVKLSEMPTSSTGADGTLSGNMGVNGFSFSDLKVLEMTDRTVWLWSGNVRLGLLLPSSGF